MFLKKCCERCQRQLDRYKNSSTEIVPYSDLACFSPHCEADCQVCKKTTVWSKGLSISQYKHQRSQIGSQVLSEKEMYGVWVIWHDSFK